MKKQLACLLTLLLAGQTLLACGGGTPAKDENNGTSAPETEQSTETAVETEEPREYANLPEKDFGGAEAKVFISYNVEGGTTNFGVPKDEFGVTEENGDAINDARYNRNLTVEETYNVKIVSYDYTALNNNTVYHDQVASNIQKLVMADDFGYAFALIQGYTACTLAQKGYLTDLYTKPNLDFTRSWWDQRATKDMTIMNRLYFTTGDISTADNDATCTVLFNKVLAQQYDLPDIYEMVLNGSWTLDRFYSLSKDVSKDLNGDGKYDKTDQYGAMIWDDIAMAVVNSTGEKCASTDQDGNVILTLNSEKTVDALTKYIEFGRDKTQCFQYQREESASDTLAIQIFTANQSLFYLQLMQIVPKLRDMKADFGIVPFPKYNETQDSYYNTVGSWHSVFFCMPMSSSDEEMSTIIAEALACEGKYNVTDAYYDLNLKTKAARDEQSAAMLDIIFDTRVYDLGWYYQFGGYNEGVMNLVRLNNPEKPFTSMYEKNEKKALNAIDKLNQTLADLEH